MKDSKLLLLGTVNALGVFAYTSAVAWIMFNGEKLFGQMTTFWGPVAFLLLFVLSASIVGLLVLGRPVHLYLNDSKKEAIKLLIYTVAVLALITLTVFTVLTNI